MEELKNLLLSPAFWFASVVIAFLMSYLASYARDWTDKWFQRRSTKRELEAKARQKDFDTKVTKIRNSPQLLGTYQADIVFQKLRQVLYRVPVYVSFALTLYAVPNDQMSSALGTLVFGLSLSLVDYWFVSRHLSELQSVVNAVLADDEYHFND